MMDLKYSLVCDFVLVAGSCCCCCCCGVNEEAVGKIGMTLPYFLANDLTAKCVATKGKRASILLKSR